MYLYTQRITVPTVAMRESIIVKPKRPFSIKIASTSAKSYFSNGPEKSYFSSFFGYISRLKPSTAPATPVALEPVSEWATYKLQETESVSEWRVQVAINDTHYWLPDDWWEGPKLKLKKNKTIKNGESSVRFSTVSFVRNIESRLVYYISGGLFMYCVLS